MIIVSLNSTNTRRRGEEGEERGDGGGQTGEGRRGGVVEGER